MKDHEQIRPYFLTLAKLGGGGIWKVWKTDLHIGIPVTVFTWWKDCWQGTMCLNDVTASAIPGLQMLPMVCFQIGVFICSRVAGDIWL